MEKKNNLFDESIKSKLERQNDDVPQVKPRDFSLIKLIVLIFVVLFALSIVLRMFIR